VTSSKKKKTEIPIEESSVEIEEMTSSDQDAEKTISEELDETRQKFQESEEKVLRLAAEFENTKRRLEREREISLKYAEENILKELLPGIDNIERAMEQGQDSNSVENLLEGIELTRNGLLATLEKFGVKAIESIGEPFDPNIHEAVAMEETEEMEPNRVLKEFQKGYQYKDRLLRAAKVIVSKG
jgi:molecular chaperone GrpE